MSSDTTPNVYAPPVDGGQPPPPQPEDAPTDGPKGIGGWLLLPILGLIATPVQLGRSLVDDYLPIMQNDWELITDKGYEYFHPLWAPLLVYEMVSAIGIGLAALLALVLIAKHDRRLPHFVIGIYVANLAYVLIDTVVALQIPVLNTPDGPSPYTDIVRATVVCAVWVPYFLKSKRVRNTFVK